MRRHLLGLCAVLIAGSLLPASVSAQAFRSAASDNANADDPIVTEPAGAASGDYLITLMRVLADSTTVTAPTGWTSVCTGTSTNTIFRYNVAWIARGGSAPSLQWDFSAAAAYEAHTIAISGGNTAALDSSACGSTGAGTTVNPDPPSTTAVAGSSLAVAGGIWRLGSSSWTASAGYTKRNNNIADGTSFLETKALAAAGAENPGAVSGASAGTTDYWDGFTLTIAPAAATSCTGSMMRGIAGC